MHDFILFFKITHFVIYNCKSLNLQIFTKPFVLIFELQNLEI